MRIVIGKLICSACDVGLCELCAHHCQCPHHQEPAGADHARPR